MSIETRVKALERQRASPLGKIRLQTAGGTERDLDALEALLYSIEAEAGKNDHPEIIGYEYLGGPLPRGGIWEPFYKMLREARSRADPAAEGQSTSKP